jgi:hypothetical protein
MPYKKGIKYDDDAKKKELFKMLLLLFFCNLRKIKFSTTQKAKKKYRKKTLLNL